ncbi:MAG: type IIL restriction-modification enzyme MmeI [Saprospiraceae bacterium]
MSSHETEQLVKRIFEHFSEDDFIYDLLLAYGISKTSVTRLKSGDFNLSKIEGEVLFKKKVIFKVAQAGQLLSTIESLVHEERNAKHAPRFAIVTDFGQLVYRAAEVFV